MVRQAVRQCFGRSAIHSGTRSEGFPGSILSTPVPTNLQSLRELRSRRHGTSPEPAATKRLAVYGGVPAGARAPIEAVADGPAQP